MPEPTFPTDLERRLADDLARYAEAARDTRPSASIAAEAMAAGRRRATWAWPWSRRMMLGLVGLLLVPLALALVGASLDRTSPTDVYRAVVLRPAGDGLDLVVTSADGEERVVRHITADGLGLAQGSRLESGSASDTGWLEVHAALPRDDPDEPTPTVAVLIDLVEPETLPIIVPGNGFTGGRWGPNGEYALYCGYPPDCGAVPVAEPDISSSRRARVIDPEQGADSEVIVRNIQLHGGGPEIIWAADGSGFLAGRTDFGVTPLDGGPNVLGPGIPNMLSRWVGPLGVLAGDFAEGITQLTPEGGPSQVWYHGELAPATPMQAQLSADGEAMWLLLDDSEANGGALLARLSGPGQVESVREIDVPGPVDGFRLSADDAAMALYLRDGSFAMAVTEAGSSSSSAGPAIDGHLVGLLPATFTDTWATNDG